MILLNNVKIPLDADFADLEGFAAKVLKISENEIISARLHRKSVDARRKSDVHFCCSLLVSAKNEPRLLKKCRDVQPYSKKEYVWEKATKSPENRPVVVGFGPAGMFAALTLARAGLSPIVLERGRDVDTRTRDVADFFEGGRLNTESNVQFGEGGAGTFSDGKLNTGIKDARIRTVLRELNRFGAPDEILVDAKPHIGTDVLVGVVKRLRKEVISLGGEVRFSSRLEDIIVEDGRVCAAVVNGEKISADRIVLATGHSARDVFALLKQKDIEMQRKPFAMGVRIEHSQKAINCACYGDFAEHPALRAADYKLAVHLPSGRSVYTFCMCPGGEVINASSEEGAIAVNGMSKSLRNGENANSALLVGVAPEDLKGDDVLEGCRLQQEIEQKAYKIANGAVPTVSVGEFLGGVAPEIQIKATVKPKTAKVDFKEIFPDFITDSLKEGIPLLAKKLEGFDNPSALLTAPETRSSCPVRVVRDEYGQSVSLRGIYPCGEGAGYAGGIMSAAIDGMKTAEKIIAELK